MKIFLLGALITLLSANGLFFYTKIRDKKNRAKNFSKEHLLEYERNIQVFLENNNIGEVKRSEDILNALGYKVEDKDLGFGVEAMTKDKVIVLNTKLDEKSRTFDLWHEIAHALEGVKDPATRKPHAFRMRDLDEQICDYYAAALILPAKEIASRMEETKYESMDRKARKRFIESIAQEKDIYKEVVAKRIEEVEILNDMHVAKNRA